MGRYAVKCFFRQAILQAAVVSLRKRELIQRFSKSDEFTEENEADRELSIACINCDQ